MLTDLSLILAQAAPAPTGPGLLEMLFPFAIMAVLFYYILIRPQKKRQKEHAEMVSSLKKGNKVVTAGGIHGIVTNVKETTVIVKVDDNTKLELEKASVERVNVGEKDEKAAPAPQAKTS